MFCLCGCNQETQKTETEGLEYVLMEDGSCYSVKGVGTATEKNIIIPSIYEGLPVKFISAFAFQNSTIESVEIPDSVTTIGCEAFTRCKNLEYVYIPKSVIRIESGAFKSCNNLTLYWEAESKPERWWSTCDYNHFNVKKSNFHNVDDVLYFTNDVTKEAILTKYDNDAKGMVKIKDTVSINGIDYTITEIDDYAFRNCNLIESIVFSDSIEKIGTNAFDLCTGLKNIEISSSIKQIEPSSFAYCNHLESIKVDPNNKIYDSRDNCNAIIETETNCLIKGCKTTVIPETVKIIGVWSFYKCDLVKIVIPEGVIHINEKAFYQCNTMFLLQIEIPNTVKTIGEGAFAFSRNFNNFYFNGTLEEWKSIKIYGSFDDPSEYANNFYVLDENNKYYKVNKK